MSSKKYGSSVVKLARSFRVNSELTPRLIESYLHSLDCPRSLAIWLLFKNNEHDQLASIKFNPLDYNSLGDTRSSYYATKYLSKFDSLNLTVNKSEAAYKKFFLFEEKCAETNRRFRNLPVHQFNGDLVWLHNVVKRKIGDILGDFCPEEWIQSCSWGPGATSTLSRREATATKKFQSQTEITRDLYSLIPLSLFGTAYPLWLREMIFRESPDRFGPCNPFRFVVGNKVVTVPKDSSIDRIIAIEPALNLWFQKGIGDCIGKRLLRVGVNLRNQTINGMLARQGSISGDLATVDLSSASDSVSYELVRELLPSDWFSILDSCRSHYGVVRNELVKWEKFSSMGNGFTFQLESLIFYSCAFAAREYVNSFERVNVYGDDIVLPVSAYSVFSRLMDFYGFTLNDTKSYFNSFFRESCGYHWYRGVDIKPTYLKSRLSSPLSVYRAANSIRRMSHRVMCNMACDHSFKSSFDLLVSSLPVVLRLRIPEPLGDGGFISNQDEASPTVLRSFYPFQHEGIRVPNLVTDVPLRYDESAGYLLDRLWSMPAQDTVGILETDSALLGLSDSQFIQRLPAVLVRYRSLKFKGRNMTPTRDLRLRLNKSKVKQWYDLGPWI